MFERVDHNSKNASEDMKRERTRPAIVGRSWHAVWALGTFAAHGLATAADDAPVQMDKVIVTGASPGPANALTEISTETARPRSTLTPQAIEQIATLTSDFGTLANLLPSFVSSAPNGNGFDAAKSMSLRGFPDGQFNLTLDGIPFADPDVFTHHSTSVFPVSSIQRIEIDRSPGSGTTLGHATIGGSLDITTLAIPAGAGAQVYGAYGSFATSLEGVRLNTAAPTVDGQTGLMANVQHLQTSGAMANTDGRRNDLLLKAESKFAGLDLTLLYSYDDYHFANPPSVTTDQLAAQGSGVGLDTIVGSPLYRGYAKTDRSADFGYARLKGDLGGQVSFSETLYTFSYFNDGFSINGDLTLPSSSQVGSGFGLPATDLAGRRSTNRYRTVGDVFQVERSFGAQVVRGGLWLEHSGQVATRNAIDLSTGLPYAINKAAKSSALYDYDATSDTMQPFVEADWKPVDALLIRPGLRYQRVSRGFDAQVVPNSKPGTAGQIDRTVHALLPSLEGNYAFTPQTHGYLQWSKGSLVPSQAFFYTANPGVSNQAKPQTSQAFQGGVIYASGPLSITADAYLVNVGNYISTTTDANKNTVYVNNGGVRYRGLEAEGNAALGAGFSLVANASLIRAQFRDDGIVSPAQRAGDTIPLAPRYIALLGGLYRNGDWSGSLTTKFVGAEYQGAGGSSDGPDRRVSPYSYTNATVTRSLSAWTGSHRADLSLDINNLFNQTPITDSAGRSAVGPAGPLLVNVLARRNFMLSLRYEL